MKKTKIYLSILLTFIVTTVLIFAFSSSSFASSDYATLVSSNAVPLEAANEVVEEPTDESLTKAINNTKDSMLASYERTDSSNANSNLYMADDNINFDSSVNGDAFFSGKNIVINGAINGNAFIAGETITINNSNITGDLFICGQSVEINGGSISSIYSFSKNIKTSKNSMITRDLIACYETGNFSGLVTRNANLYGKLTIVNVTTAKFGGDVKYSSTTPINGIEKVVSGKIDFQKRQDFSQFQQMQQLIEGLKPLYTTISIIFATISAILVGLFLLLATKEFTDKSVKIVKAKPIITLLYGLVGTIVVLFISTILTFSIIGTVAGLLLFAVIVFIGIISEFITTTTISKLISNSMHKQNGIAIIFVILFTLAIELINIIPIWGAIIKAIYCLYGFGIVIYGWTHHNIIDKNSKNSDELSTNSNMQNGNTEISTDKSTEIIDVNSSVDDITENATVIEAQKNIESANLKTSKVTSTKKATAKSKLLKPSVSDKSAATKKK